MLYAPVRADLAIDSDVSTRKLLGIPPGEPIPEYVPPTSLLTIEVELEKLVLDVLNVGHHIAISRLSRSPCRTAAIFTADYAPA
jgi:hypothetical protein